MKVSNNKVSRATTDPDPVTKIEKAVQEAEDQIAKGLRPALAVWKISQAHKIEVDDLYKAMGLK